MRDETPRPRKVLQGGVRAADEQQIWGDAASTTFINGKTSLHCILCKISSLPLSPTPFHYNPFLFSSTKVDFLITTGQL